MILKNIDPNKEYTTEELAKILYKTIYELNIFLEKQQKEAE